METPTETNLAGASKRVAQRLLVICENRLELLTVELQEERERMLRAMLLAMGAVAFGVLAGVALTIVIAIGLWGHSPVIALLILTALYAAAAIFLYGRLTRLQRHWRTLAGTLEQLKKDSECLKEKFN